jgi:hypothetical protein
MIYFSLPNFILIATFPITNFGFFQVLELGEEGGGQANSFHAGMGEMYVWFTINTPPVPYYTTSSNSSSSVLIILEMLMW